MGHSFFITNEARTIRFLATDFREVFWYDEFGILKDLGCAPIAWFKNQLIIDDDGFYELKTTPENIETWLIECRKRLASRKDTLPNIGSSEKIMIPKS